MNKQDFHFICSPYTFIGFIILSLCSFFLGVGLPLPAHSNTLEQKTGDFHICYFSLNNEKEFTEMEKFTERINQHSHCSISVKEYMTEGQNPEESFKKMIDSGVRCDGLVISGHHTGSFGGKRSSGNLNIGFLEKLACNKKYSKWFNNINALWLQGCRTLGTGEIVTNEEEVSADYHTARVGNVLEADHLEQSFADLNTEFSATLDQDNPLSSRYLRAFPAAMVFGWTKTAPGERSGSQYSIPFHMAHISRIINNQDQFPTDSPIKGTWTEKSAIQYTTAMLNVLNRNVGNQCKEQMTEAWKEHGRVRDQATEYGFSNPDLNAYKPLLQTKDNTLQQARVYDCLLKHSKGDKLLEVLDLILKDPTLIRYTYNTLLEKLLTLKKKDPDLYSRLVSRLRGSSEMKEFLSRKFQSKRLGILRKIDYFSFYEEIYGENEKIQNIILDKATDVFKKIPSDSDDRVDYKRTLLSSLAKHGYLKKGKGYELVKTAAKDSNPGVRGQAMRAAGRIGEKALPILEQGAKDSSSYVRISAMRAAGDIGEKGLPILEQGAKDSDSYVRKFAMRAAEKIGEKALPILEQGAKDRNPGVRISAMEAAGDIGEKALPILEQGAKDSNPNVRKFAMRAAGDIGEKALPILEQGAKDRNPGVRKEAIQEAGRIGEKALPVIEMGAGDSHKKVRATAMLGAGRIGEKGLPILEQGAKDGSSSVRATAMLGAGRIGEKGLPILEQGAKDGSLFVRGEAMYAVGDIGEKALPILEQGLKDSNSFVWRSALLGARKIGEKALPMLRQALNDPDLSSFAREDIEDIIEGLKKIKTKITLK